MRSPSMTMPSPSRRRVSAAPSRSRKSSATSPDFDMQLFLGEAGLGRRVAKFQGKETIFSQGDSAKNVMYIQEGGVKLTVVNKTGKEAVVAILGREISSGKGAWRASRFAWRLRPRLHLPQCW